MPKNKRPKNYPQSGTWLEVLAEDGSWQAAASTGHMMDGLLHVLLPSECQYDGWNVWQLADLKGLIQDQRAWPARLQRVPGWRCQLHDWMRCQHNYLLTCALTLQQATSTSSHSSTRQVCGTHQPKAQALPMWGTR